MMIKSYLGRRKADWISSLFNSLDKSELVILGLGKLKIEMVQFIICVTFIHTLTAIKQNSRTFIIMK